MHNRIDKADRLQLFGRLVEFLYLSLPEENKNGEQVYTFEVNPISGIHVGDDVEIKRGLVSVIERTDNGILCTLLLDNPEEMKEVRRMNGETMQIDWEMLKLLVPQIKNKKHLTFTKIQ